MENNGSDTKVVQSQVIITVTDPLTMAMSIQVITPTIDYALNMLEQARRNLEAEYNKAKHMEMLAEVEQQSRASRLVIGDS